MPYVNGVVSVGTTATLIATPSTVPEYAASWYKICPPPLSISVEVRSRLARPRPAACSCPRRAPRRVNVPVHWRGIGGVVRNRRLRYGQCRVLVPGLTKASGGFF